MGCLRSEGLLFGWLELNGRVGKAEQAVKQLEGRKICTWML